MSQRRLPVATNPKVFARRLPLPRFQTTNPKVFAGGDMVRGSEWFAASSVNAVVASNTPFS